jgi:hypothetical protein
MQTPLGSELPMPKPKESAQQFGVGPSQLTNITEQKLSKTPVPDLRAYISHHGKKILHFQKMSI